MIVGEGSVAEVSVHVDSVFDDEETRGHSSFLGSEREVSRDRVRDLESNDRCGVGERPNYRTQMTGKQKVKEREREKRES